MNTLFRPFIRKLLKDELHQNKIRHQERRENKEVPIQERASRVLRMEVKGNHNRRTVQQSQEATNIHQSRIELCGRDFFQKMKLIKLLSVSEHI